MTSDRIQPRFRRVREARLILAGLALLAVLGCGRRDADEADRLAGAGNPRPTASAENPADIPHPCPPQPAGPQVGRSDSRLNSASPQLVDWAALWAQALPGFATDSLWRVGSTRWSLAGGSQYEPHVLGDNSADPGDLLAFALLGIRSPDGRYTLDVDSYQAITPEGDGLIVGGEPDSRCTLIDEREHREYVLQQCGTPGGFHWGTWTSASSFAVGGWYDADDYGQWKQGRLWLYSLRDSTVSEFQTRIVSSDTYTNYEAAWRDWLLRRYHALRRSRPAD